MLRALLSLSILALPLAGCMTTRTVTSAPKADSADSAKKVQDQERQLELARSRLAVAVLEAKAFDAKHDARIRHETAEVHLAEAALAKFVDADLPNRLASETLDLQAGKDHAQEAADELAQIELMYAEQDLDDMTREFVISRGRRNAERSAQRIAIEEAAFSALKELELPQERAKLALALDQAKSGLAAAELEGEIGRQEQAIAVKEAESKIVELEAELAELKTESKAK